MITMIIIVGAGLAGLSAAYRLISNPNVDPEQILILEARDKIGGRIESLTFSDGSRIDLGAQWLHGEKNNPLFGWLDSLGFIQGPEEEESEFEGIFSTPSGIIPSRHVVSRALDLLIEAKNFLYKVAHKIDKRARVDEIYKKHIDSEINRCPNFVGTDRSLINAIERWFELYEMIDNSCEKISNLSIKAYSCWTDFDDGKMMLLKGGWQNVVNMMADFIGRHRVRLSHQVKQIKYEHKGVLVSIIDDRGSSIELKCDHVIMSCSIGVYKTFGSSLFVPPLDASKLRRMCNIGFGVVNKIFLQFSEPFLHEEKGLKLLWTTENTIDAHDSLPEWAKFITGFDLITDAPNYLLGWIGGRGAELIEQISDETVGQVCLKIFNMFLPTKNVPELVWTKKSAWHSDNHIRGAYSYPSVKSINDDMSDLWDPLYCTAPSTLDDSRSAKKIPRVLFAGEATADNMYATAHGAILSGWREADRLADYVADRNNET